MAIPKKKNISVEDIVVVESTKTKLQNGRQAIEFEISEEAKKIIEEFKENLVESNKAPTTIKSYIFDVKSFISFIESVGIIFTGEFNANQYNDYIKAQIDLEIKPTTIKKRRNSLQQYNIFLESKKYMNSVIIISKNDGLPIK
ncbi:hypothetical protein [Clostridium estertheticum]|uniref:Core-binding (CB) domain-containing protein n=1 Tax=Clostridium estertheticum subsp. estertheticum TaxID=1552 RepID=A0A1J0GC00_9CLOT|nr:hypothetical protein [Clostridium estertheticum]APC38885.1 hypothetical protein A7L45_01780 [Clostridium estertheticum subsp. estertheticum]MBZ9615170.1 hypothetical protein [Clostridium estertheticum subsp. laramiense]WAG75063.1 hypothetical protein LL032_06325 [Clostridium estertheticum]